MDLRDRIKAHKELITDRLDPDFGFLDELLARRSLTRSEVAKVKAVSDSYAKSEKLLEYVFEKGIHDKFLEALRNTEQTHLVNYILNNGECCPEVGNDWPLTEREIFILDSNQRSLVDLLDTCDLLPYLYSQKVVNNRQRDFVSSKTASHEKNDALLEILGRTSIRNYKRTIDCLRFSNQSHLACVLKGDGVVVRVRSELETKSNVNEVEDELITEISEKCRDLSLRDLNHIQECIKSLIAAKNGHSINLYFFCKTSAEVISLQEMQTSGKLANVLKELFNEILCRAEVSNLRTILHDGLFKSELGFRSVGAKVELKESCDEGEGSVTSNTDVLGQVEMAHGGEKLEKQLREITQCSICMNAFTGPRMLPCIHTFCLACLDCTSEAAHMKPGDKMPCPLCRKKFTIPADGMHGVQKNFFMQNLLGLKTTQQMGSNSICDMCNIRNEDKTGNTPTATMRCLECQDNYCDSCVKVHQYQKLSRNHQVVKIGSDAISERKKPSTTMYCSKHTQKPLDYYCADCKKIVCVSCIDESHKIHDCKGFTSVEKEFRQIIQRNSTKISIYADEMLSLRKNAEIRKADFLKEIAEKENAIHKRNQELRKMIDEHTERLLIELSVIKARHLKEMETALEEIHRCCTILRRFEAYCNELTSIGSARDICCSVDEIIVRADKLEIYHEVLLCGPHRSVIVSLQETDLSEVLQKSNNILGQIKAKREATSWSGNYAVIVGLDDGTNITEDVIKINLHRSNEISKQEEIPTRMVTEAFAAIYSNTMYVTGTGVKKDEIWKYNITSSWMKCASLAQGRRRHSAAFIDEVLYICGGFVDSNKIALDSVEAYNAVTDKCTAVGKLAHGVQCTGNCVPYKSSLYIFGGSDKDDNSVSHVQVYNTKENTCTLISKPMPRPYRSMRAVLWGTSVILLGSYTCFIYNLEAETWQERKQFKTGVVHFGLILEKEKLFVIGGGTNEKERNGKMIWKCRSDVRYVPCQDVLDEKSVEWKIHTTLPQPALIYAYEKLTFLVS